MGGEYYRVKGGAPTGWNPAALKPTKRNIAFMKDLIRLICTLNNNTLDDYQNGLISDAVERLMARKIVHSLSVNLFRLFLNQMMQKLSVMVSRLVLKRGNREVNTAGSLIIAQILLTYPIWMFLVLMVRNFWMIKLLPR
jgi:hypothetical protein